MTESNCKQRTLKQVLVTGAGGGMGRAVCTLLTQQGYQVWGLDKTFEEGLPYSCIKADLTKQEDVDAAFSEISKAAGRLSAIVHLAGLYDLGSLVELAEERFCHIFEVNLFAVYRINKTFLPLLEPNSRILLTSSELAPLTPLPFTGLYGITKSAVEKYACSLRMELQLLGHKVSLLRPGAVSTGLLKVSTTRLDEFCDKTMLYSCNAKRFKRIVDRVESKNISPEKLALRVLRFLRAKRPRYVYNINRNPLLRLWGLMTPRLQTWVIRQILT